MTIIKSGFKKRKFDKVSTLSNRYLTGKGQDYKELTRNLKITAIV